MIKLVMSEIFKLHNPNLPHPESPARLRALESGIRELELEGVKFELITPEPAEKEVVAKVHSEMYLKVLDGLRGKEAELDPDTLVTPNSVDVAYMAVGGCLRLAERLEKNELGIALIRPPGHHAEPSRAMGFCLLNNIAITAQYLIDSGTSRVAILDLDVHHGNGTQEIFYERSDVFYLSTHQIGIYPGTGYPDERGEGQGEGYTLNVPLFAGAGDREFLKAYYQIIFPKVEEFRPQFLLVSLGFDCMRGDPLANLNVTPEGFREVFKGIKELSRKLKLSVLCSLEGGYNMDNLQEGIKAVVRGWLES